MYIFQYEYIFICINIYIFKVSLFVANFVSLGEILKEVSLY